MPAQSKQNAPAQKGTSYTAVVTKTVVIVTVAGGCYIYYKCKDMTRDEIYLRAVGKLLSTEWGISMGKYLLSKYRQSHKPETPKPTIRERLTNYFYGDASPVEEVIEPVVFGMDRTDSVCDKRDTLLNRVKSMFYGSGKDADVVVVKARSKSADRMREQIEQLQNSDVDVIHLTEEEIIDVLPAVEDTIESDFEEEPVSAVEELSTGHKHQQWGSGCATPETPQDTEADKLEQDEAEEYTSNSGLSVDINAEAVEEVMLPTIHEGVERSGTCPATSVNVPTADQSEVGTAVSSTVPSRRYSTVSRD